jgi:epoxyqueuosine reductase
MEHHALFETLFASSGAAGWGCCAFSDLTLTETQKAEVYSLCAQPEGVLIAAYPYFAGEIPGNLSLYARGEDYHLVLGRRLAVVCAALEDVYPGHHFLPGADNSPLPEVQIARRAGLGIQGRNGLVILPPYGSYLFLGTILTDLPLESPTEEAPGCLDCGACLRACPGNALGEMGVDESRCLSALTQKKGTLTEEETALLQTHPLIWGCDRCQQVCPYNREAAVSPLPDLTGKREEIPYLASLSSHDLEGLTNRTFRSTYGNRAFAWRGPAVLRRNLQLKEESSADPPSV